MFILLLHKSIVVFNDQDRSYTSRQLCELFPLRIKHNRLTADRTSFAAVSSAKLEAAADKHSMFNKPTGIVVWLSKCVKCAAVKPFFKQQTDKVMKYSLPGKCMELCTEKPKPWKRNRHDEAPRSSRHAPTSAPSHRFYEKRTL